MLIFLDTRDLIRLLERRQPCDVARLDGLFRAGGHRLCVSIAGITELSAPLEQGDGTGPSTMKTLADLETLPLNYLVEDKVVPDELQSASAAFPSFTTPVPVDPFESRFDLAIEARTDTRLFLNYSLAEIVFDLWRGEPEVFWKRSRHESTLRMALEGDRNLTKLPSMRERFRSTISRHFTLYGLAPPDDLTAFSDWLFEDPRLCPGTRLVFEVFQVLVKDRHAAAEASHFADLSHIACLPYVDLMTLDAQMRSYLQSATRRDWPDGLGGAVVSSVEDILPLV